MCSKSEAVMDPTTAGMNFYNFMSWQWTKLQYYRYHRNYIHPPMLSIVYYRVCRRMERWLHSLVTQYCYERHGRSKTTLFRWKCSEFNTCQPRNSMNKLPVASLKIVLTIPWIIQFIMVTSLFYRWTFLTRFFVDYELYLLCVMGSSIMNHATRRVCIINHGYDKKQRNKSLAVLSRCGRSDGGDKCWTGIDIFTNLWYTIWQIFPTGIIHSM